MDGLMFIGILVLLGIVVEQWFRIRDLEHRMADDAAYQEVYDREVEGYIDQLRDDLRLANLASLRAPSRKGGIIDRARR